MSCLSKAPSKHRARGDRFIPVRLDDESRDVRQFLMYAAPASSSPSPPLQLSNDDKNNDTSSDSHRTTITRALPLNSNYTHDVAHRMFGGGDAPLMAEYGDAISCASLVCASNASNTSGVLPISSAARMLTFSSRQSMPLKLNAHDDASQRIFHHTSAHGTSSASSPIATTSSTPTNVFDTQPSTILDAPGLVDDFYMDVLDWSVCNLMALALRDQVLLYNPTERKLVHIITPVPNPSQMASTATFVTAVKFSPSGAYLAISMYDGSVHIWDVASASLVHIYAAPAMDRFVPSTVMRLRAACLAWQPGSSDAVLSVGGNDPWIYHYDALRTPTAPVMQWPTNDDDKIAGMVYAPNGDTLAAGTNDGDVLLWTNLASSSSPSTTPPHAVLKAAHANRATVRALAFCPWRPNILATGGGSSDRCVRIWNVASSSSQQTSSNHSAGSNANTVSCIKTLPQSGQVTNVLWTHPSIARANSTNLRRAATTTSSTTTSRSGHLVVTHGFYANTLVSSHQAFGGWRRSGCTTFDRTQRALYSALSPDGSTLAIGDSDERLCFWQLRT